MVKEMMRSFEDFYKGKKVMVTGHTGFKGAWLSLWLHSMGARVSGLALDPLTENDLFCLLRLDELLENDYRTDIRDLDSITKAMRKSEPEILFHLAAQPLVSESYTNPLYTFSTNIMGTANILEAARHSASVKALLLITSDKCYENTGKRDGYTESDPMGGFDPYSASKGAAELVISSYRRSFVQNSKMPAIASARAGNVLGGGDRAKDRIIPDCIRAFESEQPVTIRNPEFTRPWQHVLEPLGGYLLLARKLAESGEAFSGAWNFGPEEIDSHTVRELTEEFIKAYGAGSVKAEGPANMHEASYLSLNISKAKESLGWLPLLSFRECVEMTAEWYRNTDNVSPRELCLNQITKYMMLWKSEIEN